MALFSILSKIIVVDNVSNNIKEFFGVMDRLDELESNTYEALGYQKMEQTQAKIKAVQQHQKEVHQERLKQIQHNPINTMNSTQTMSSSLPYTLSGYYQIDKQPESPYTQTKESKAVIKPLGNQGVESRSTKPKQHKKVKALDLKLYDEAETKLLKILWDNGNVKYGDALVSRRSVLKEVGTLKGKSGVLTNLYEKLVKNGYVEFNIRYIARAELARQVYQELEE
jgi:hypothetical protein